jgi:hypothetical protein
LKVGGAERNALVGEAPAMRALAHFDLVGFYGQNYSFFSGASHQGISTGLTFDQGRNTVAEVYAQVESDLERATGFVDNDGNPYF